MATAKKPKFRKRAQPESDAVAFLRAMTPPGINGVVIAIDPEKGNGAAGQIAGCAYTVETMENVAAFIEKHCGQHHNIYWSINPTKTPQNKKPEKTDIAAMRFAHLDLDELSDEALERVRNYEIPPTTIVKSGGGYNVYWALAEPVRANGNIEDLEGVNRGIIMALNADPGTQNLDRILRVPGTTNWPTKAKKRRGRVPVEAVLLEHDPSRVYPLDAFTKVSVDEFEAWKKSRPKKTTGDKSEDKKEIDRSKDLLRKVAEDIAKGLDDDEIHAKRDTHEHAADQDDPTRAVQRCINKVRTDATEAIKKINSENSLIFVSGALLVMWPQTFEDGLPRLSKIGDVKNYWKPLQRGKTSPVDLWLGSRSRNQYSGFCFRPSGTHTKDKFNLFRGWGVKPDPAGDCSLFLAHLLKVICNGDEDLFDYVIQWFANSVQTPEDKPGTALSMRSRQGGGKGAVARYTTPIYGAHFQPLSGSEQLLGRFNDMLAGKILVFGDEAAWPGDKRGLDKLSSYITEERISVDRKNIPAITIDNYARFIFATYKEHSAPVALDDRRFVVLYSSDERIGDRDYWAALEAERKGAGPAAFLHHLLNNVKLIRDLRTTPKTAALAEQKLMGLDDIGQFARELMMREKHLLHNPQTGGQRIVAWGEVISTQTLHAFYLDYVKRNGSKYSKSMDAMGINLRRFFTMNKREPRKDERERLNLGRSRGVQVYALPTLAEARASFEKALGQPITWPKYKDEAGQ